MVHMARDSSELTPTTNQPTNPLFSPLPLPNLLKQNIYLNVLKKQFTISPSEPSSPFLTIPIPPAAIPILFH